MLLLVMFLAHLKGQSWYFLHSFCSSSQFTQIEPHSLPSEHVHWEQSFTLFTYIWIGLTKCHTLFWEYVQLIQSFKKCSSKVLFVDEETESQKAKITSMVTELLSTGPGFNPSMAPQRSATYSASLGPISLSLSSTQIFCLDHDIPNSPYFLPWGSTESCPDHLC